MIKVHTIYHTGYDPFSCTTYLYVGISYIICRSTAAPTTAAAAAAATEKLGPHSLCRNVYIPHIKKLSFNGLWPLIGLKKFISDFFLEKFNANNLKK